MEASNALTKVIESLVEDIKKGICLNTLRAKCQTLGASADLALKIVRIAEIKSKN